jgi:hypothetical protein
VVNRTIYEGQRIAVEMKFRVNGSPEDPTIAQFYTRKPDGTTVVLTYPDANFVRLERGTYEAYVTPDAGGTWNFRVESAGVVDSAQEEQVYVQESIF